jgi:hypothetical protein
MARTILIPIDFRVASLNTLKLALEAMDGEPVRVVLMHAAFLSDSISDLLFYSPSRFIEARMGEAFQEALEVIRNRFEASLESCSIQLYHGMHKNALQNFLEAHQVDLIFLPPPGRLKFDRSAFDPLPLLRKSGYACHEMAWTPSSNPSEQAQLISLFN